MDSDIVIVPMGLGHLRQVLDLGHEVFDINAKPYTSWSLTSVAEHLDSPDNACWVALDSDRVVGFVLGSMEFELRDDWAYLEWIAVAPDMQGHGIARRLVDVCSEALFARGARRIVTDVESHNRASAALMERSGFTAAATVTLYVRPNPDDPEPESAESLPAVPIGTKRDLIRRGRLAGEKRGARS
ncbi:MULTISPECIES: GNAT family N-acetyltransferase [unclassified Nocardia]|uniref:GNAT family N-acetyltransferase n=1 Tax=unclassified Nocardia TaxID=2637762 RepID=UPI001CE49FBC|nr:MULTISPECIES: GNAT family N-acetyltransferase [unclassified Nocardia]